MPVLVSWKADRVVRLRQPIERVTVKVLRELTPDSPIMADRAPWRVLRQYKGQKHLSGLFWSSTMGGHVGYESLLELSRLLIADFDPDVVFIGPGHRDVRAVSAQHAHADHVGKGHRRSPDGVGAACRLPPGAPDMDPEGTLTRDPPSSAGPLRKQHPEGGRDARGARGGSRTGERAGPQRCRRRDPDWLSVNGQDPAAFDDLCPEAFVTKGLD
jgi:hypothetical protein